VDLLPPLSDEACVQFIELIRTYTVNLPKSQDEDDFHLETVRLSVAIDVSLKSIHFSVLTFFGHSKVWCTENDCSFKDLEHILIRYNELGNAINAAQAVFRRIGYMQLLIPDAMWEDPERRPKIVRHLILSVKTHKALFKIRDQQITCRMMEAPIH